MEQRSLVGRLRRLEGRWKAAAERYGTSRPAIAVRLAELYLTRGFRPVEALELGMADPRVSNEDVAGCFTKQEFMELQDALNPSGLTSLTEEKSVFYPLCESLGLPVPKTYAVVARSGGWAPGGMPVTRREEWERVAQALPEVFLSKPSAGVYGEGVYVWRRQDEAFLDQNGRRCSVGELFELFRTDDKYDRFIVQERLLNHPRLVELTGCEALQTARVATFVPSTGEAEVAYAEWKCVVGANVVDNFRHGQTGNLTVNIALKTGTLGPAHTHAADGLGAKVVSIHPGTQKPLEGFVLPDWEAVLALAKRAAWLFLPLRTIGWDVGLTPRGPVLVEGNRWWDPPNGAVLGPSAPGVMRHEMISAAHRLRKEAEDARKK